MRKISEDTLQDFQKTLHQEEMSDGTIKQYMRAIRMFRSYTGEKDIQIEIVLEYKKKISEEFAVATVNTMLAAMNRLFRYLDWQDCIVKSCRVQNNSFRAKELELSVEEYHRLVSAAERQGNERLSLLIQTLASTGIRIGELPFVTVNAAKERKTLVTLKGKTRIVILPRKLCEKLLQYSQKQRVESGSIFVTRTGRPVDRSNVLHEMKMLCPEAGVEERKVFPHNFRHLFACQFYQSTKDMTRLADILGHTNLNTTRIYTSQSWEEQVQWLEGLHLVV